VKVSKFKRILFKSVCFLIVIGLLGCNSPSSRVAVPEATQNDVLIEGMGSSVRFWGDIEPKNLRSMITTKTQQMLVEDSEAFQKTISYLALSGGGENGAFGAGLLSGWSEHGNRPDFNVVTGVSIGALIAPFAFLGSEYDQQLKIFFTTLATEDLIETGLWNTILAFAGASALADTTPLANKIERFITPDLVAKVAVEHLKGRRLFIGTTNLDAQRPVIWDMGEIARQATPEALSLFRKVMLASAAIPGVMPPVYFVTHVGDDKYKELHVDGGVSSQVFIYPMGLDLSRYRSELSGHRTLYIIKNSKLAPEYLASKEDAFSVSTRSISTLIKNQGIGDLYQMKIIADRDQLDYRLASVGSEFEHDAKELLDREYMTALFNYGYQLGVAGYHWKLSPEQDKLNARKEK